MGLLRILTNSLCMLSARPQLPHVAKVSMAQTPAERQAAYRRNRATAGPKGDGERRINTWVSTGAALALARLAHRDGVTHRKMLERLILAADSRIVRRLDPDAPEWMSYFTVTQ